MSAAEQRRWPGRAIVPVVHDTMIIQTPSLSRAPVTSTDSPVVGDRAGSVVGIGFVLLMIAHSPSQHLRLPS